MTKQEMVEIWEEQVKEAEIMVSGSRRNVDKWEALLDLRRECLQLAKAALLPQPRTRTAKGDDAKGRKETVQQGHGDTIGDGI